MSTHARKAKSKVIRYRLETGAKSTRTLSGVLRYLECDHWVEEPRGGRAHLAQRAFCPHCAPKTTYEKWVGKVNRQGRLEWSKEKTPSTRDPLALVLGKSDDYARATREAFGAAAAELLTQLTRGGK